MNPVCTSDAGAAFLYRRLGRKYRATMNIRSISGSYDQGTRKCIKDVDNPGLQLANIDIKSTAGDGVRPGSVDDVCPGPGQRLASWIQTTPFGPAAITVTCGDGGR